MSVSDFCITLDDTVDRECIANLGTCILNAALALTVCVATFLLCSDRPRRARDALFEEHNSRWVLTFAVIAVHLFELADGALILLRREQPRQNFHPMLAAGTSIVAVVLGIYYYHKVEKYGRPRRLSVLLIFWSCVVALKMSKLVILYGKDLGIEHATLEATWFGLVFYIAMFLVELSTFLQKFCSSQAYQCKSELRGEANGDDQVTYRYSRASLLSKCTFFWLVPLLRQGYRRPLELADLGFLPEKHTNENQFQRFNYVYSKEKAKAEAKGTMVSLWCCYLKTYWRTALAGGLIKVIGDVIGLVGPLSISLILEYVDDVTTNKSSNSSADLYPTAGEVLSNGYILSFIILIATFMQSTFSNNFNHMAIMESVHVRSALQSLVYLKSLSLASDIDVGMAVNHMSVDSFNVMLLFSMGHYIWAVPVKLTILLVLLYKQLGYSALVGAATIYVLAPLQYWICTKLSELQKESLSISDKRIKHTSELLQGIKLLKLHGWERVYANMVKQIRREELAVLRKDAIFVALNTFITQGSAILLTLVTFSLYSVIEGRPLTPAQVFSGLALFNQLTVPLYIIPVVIPIVINAIVSTKRLSEFLSQPEVGTEAPWRKKDDTPKAVVEFHPESGSVLLNIRDSELLDKFLASTGDDSDVFLSDAYSPIDSPAVINMNHAYFTYDNNTKIPILQDVNITVPTGKLTIIIGPVGSGKTTLLAGMLGELTPYKGSVHWANTTCIAYVPQKPWLLNATLKENILFGQQYDGRRYHQVIQACALQPDIDLLPARDMTEIGERGFNLSGGQRQRIALARAFYSPAKAVILDDPLSALDTHVGMHVFEQGIRSLLLRRHRTVVLVTHKQDLLIHASKVIILEGGKIRCQGNLAEIEKLEPDLATVLSCSTKREVPSSRDNTTKERHKLMRMITKQSLYLPNSGSTQDLRQQPRPVTLSRQLSHDPSSPLPLHDLSNDDTSAAPRSSCTPRPTSVGFRFKASVSTDSMHSASTGVSNSSSLVRNPWMRSPPSRLSSRVSNTAENFIEEEEEYEESEGKKEGLLANGTGQLGDDGITGPLLGGPDSLALAEEAQWKVIEDEDREQGKIPCSVYLDYMKSCRLLLVALVCVLFAANQGARLGSDFWLTGWSEASRDINVTVPASKDELAWSYLMGYLGLSVFCIVLSLVTNISAQLVSLRSVKVFHNNMIDNIVQCPMRFFDSNPIGRIINRFSSDMGVIDKKLPVTIPVLLRFLMLCLSAILVDVCVTPYFSIVVVLVVAVYYYIQSFFRHSSRELQRLDSITKSPVFSHFSETLSGLSTIRAYREEGRFVERMNEHINDNNLAFIMVNCANCWLGVSLDYLGGVILFLATISSLTAAIMGTTSTSFVGIAMTYTLLVPIYLNWLVRQVSNVEMYMSSVERVNKYCHLPIEQVPSPVEVPLDWPSKGEVRFEKVTMTYEAGLDPILRNVSVTFAPGEKVGICGRTGSGKSSLVMGLFKMVPVCEGKIFVDDIDISLVPCDVLRSRLAIIPQEPILFSGTIRQNLDPKRVHTDEELWNVLEKAHLKEIVALYGGLDGEVHEEGSNFSIGQKQLFCFARALLQPSKVLILDEATSSLDVKLDNLIQETVLNEWANSTVLAIAHRVTGLLNFDKIVVLEAGHIVESGSPAELKQKRGSIFMSLLKEAEQ
ncbi:ATP-binding cassette sub-family C member 9-like isoform X2 [Rhipicephalus microplus]|uniref:ATP-binding cassette sub-family C member 9-like isoform X2 n=1 Tax=Rhipicephalus microplus TaxID=6941 RepID=UPI003F6D8312